MVKLNEYLKAGKEDSENFRFANWKRNSPKSLREGWGKESGGRRDKSSFDVIKAIRTSNNVKTSSNFLLLDSHISDAAAHFQLILSAVCQLLFGLANIGEARCRLRRWNLQKCLLLAFGVCHHITISVFLLSHPFVFFTRALFSP